MCLSASAVLRRVCLYLGSSHTKCVVINPPLCPPPPPCNLLLWIEAQRRRVALSCQVVHTCSRDESAKSRLGVAHRTRAHRTTVRTLSCCACSHLFPAVRHGARTLPRFVPLEPRSQLAHTLPVPRLGCLKFSAMPVPPSS